MRVLTVRQPWAWAIIHGGKDVENRTRNIAGGYRGEVAIHAGKARFEDDGDMWEVRRAITSEINGWPASDSDVWASDMVEPDDERFVYGAVIGVVDLVDVHPCRGQDLATEPIGGCTPWADYGAMHHLVLENPRALWEPIAAKGRLGLWKPDLALVDAIATQMFDIAEGSVVPACSKCGCTDDRACFPTCSWVHREGDPPLCSECGPFAGVTGWL